MKEEGVFLQVQFLQALQEFYFTGTFKGFVLPYFMGIKLRTTQLFYLLVC